MREAAGAIPVFIDRTAVRHFQIGTCFTLELRFSATKKVRKMLMSGHKAEGQRDGEVTVWPGHTAVRLAIDMIAHVELHFTDP